MGIQKKRPSSRSLPAGRAGFAVNACSLGMPHARACGKARRHRRLATRRVFLSEKKIICVTARLFAPARAHVTSQISVGWRRSADYPLPAISPITANLQGISKNCGFRPPRRPKFQRKRGALDQTSLISKTRDYLGAAGKSAAITRERSDVRFSCESGHLRCKTACPLWAKSGHDLKKMELGKSAFL